MLAHMPLPLLSLVFSFVSLALAIPTWESFTSRDSISTLVPGASYIEALGPKFRGEKRPMPKFLSVAAERGVGGRAIAVYDPSPPMFFVSPRDGQFYQVTNETSILYVNVVNTTAPAAPSSSSSATGATSSDGTQAAFHNPKLGDAPDSARPSALPPLKLELGKKRTGLTGAWRWVGTMLHFDAGSGGQGRSNQGAFYACTDDKGASGVYMFLEPSATPAQCTFLTMHSWVRDRDEHKR